MRSPLRAMLQCTKNLLINTSIPYQFGGIPFRARSEAGVSVSTKGFIVDISVIYSVLALIISTCYHDRYRFDRYHVLNNATLADSMFSYIQEQMISDIAVCDLADKNKPLTKELKPATGQFRASLKHASIQFDSQEVSADQVAVTPLVGIGKRRNRLNQELTNWLLA